MNLRFGLLECLVFEWDSTCIGWLLVLWMKKFREFGRVNTTDGWVLGRDGNRAGSG